MHIPFVLLHNMVGFQVSLAVIPSDRTRKPLTIARKDRNHASFGVLLLAYQGHSCHFTEFSP